MRRISKINYIYYIKSPPSFHHHQFIVCPRPRRLSSESHFIAFNKIVPFAGIRLGILFTENYIIEHGLVFLWPDYEHTSQPSRA